MTKEILLHQRFVYAEIESYRNYSRIIDRPVNVMNSTFDTDDVLEDIDNNIRSSWGVVAVKKPTQTVLTLGSEKGSKYKNTKFFYSGEDVDVRITLNPFFPKKEPYLTTSDRHIKKYFGNPFTHMKIHINERVVILNGDKLTVKLDYYIKERHLNAKFYKRTPHVTGFTINLKTGDITSFGGIYPNLKCRKNSFVELLFLLRHKSLINYEGVIRDSKRERDECKHYLQFYKEFREILNDEELIRTLHQVLSGHLPLLPLSHNLYDVEDNSMWLHRILLWLLVDKKGIKVPNDYYNLLQWWYPTMKYLRKNDNKLIAGILDRLKIKSKTTIKLMHEHPELDIRMILILVKFFGRDELHKFISNLNPDYFKLNGKFGPTFGSKTNYEIVGNDINVYPINKNEKGNVLKLINEYVHTYTTSKKDVESFQSFLAVIADHCEMLGKLKKYFPNISFTATNNVEFSREHTEFSTLISKIRKGFTIEYIFDDELLEYIKFPIFLNGNIFYPVLLKLDDEYIEEGKHMHHCVGSYSDKERSIIISLRLDSETSRERVTCEFDVSTKKCLQARHFCNKQPPEVYDDALTLLKKRILEYKGGIGSKEKKKTILTINGVPVREEVVDLDVFV